ncbi:MULTISPECIES: BlaI/MecI/CopY family transcriptional regulator [unclassified Caldicellulosiruptor]|uniref:BlaI/MecI/CopY family transcriptional regulator n=1 Tax=unclassified Caldicellulosiruptor TaxID=2622462 RepID=UPI00039D2512|nr:MULTISPECIES: BlaI/MecI/CopY family transcriptional regulator [unclassified Caldicellulosiruptor]
MKEKSFPKISKAELEVMKVVWKENRVLSGREIVTKVMETNKKWHKNTIFTLIDRLAKKGALKVEKKGKFNFYTASITEEDYKKEEARDILQRMFGGSFRNVIATFLETTNVSKKEIEEIKKMLDEKGCCKYDNGSF